MIILFGRKKVEELHNRIEELTKELDAQYAAVHELNEALNREVQKNIEHRDTISSMAVEMELYSTFVSRNALMYKRFKEYKKLFMEE